MSSDFPFIDSRIEFVGVGKLRSFTNDNLKDLKNIVVVIGRNNEPIGVLINYKQYLDLQNRVEELKNGTRSC